MERQRLFSLEEANRNLPAVREIVISMQERKGRIGNATRELDELTDSSGGNGHASAARVSMLQTSIAKFAAELDELVAKLEEIGAELKGIDDGLIDFPSEREGRVVYLCWKLGEDEIEWWHELDTGFAGRLPL